MLYIILYIISYYHIIHHIIYLMIYNSSASDKKMCYLLMGGVRGKFMTAFLQDFFFFFAEKLGTRAHTLNAHVRACTHTHTHTGCQEEQSCSVDGR